MTVYYLRDITTGRYREQENEPVYFLHRDEARLHRAPGEEVVAITSNPTRRLTDPALAATVAPQT